MPPLPVDSLLGVARPSRGAVASTVACVNPRVGARPKRLELVLAGCLAAATSLLLLVLGPVPGDEPAHLYRTLLARNNAIVWDNLWYGGHYPLAYSLFYYPLANVVGNLPLVLAAVVAAAWLFSAICIDEWGEAARWPSRLFGILAAAPLFTALYSYALGLAALLGALPGRFSCAAAGSASGWRCSRSASAPWRSRSFV